MNKLLKDCCCIELSNVDKKRHPNQRKVRLCNFTDVYYNWNIYNSMDEEYMEATASDKSIKKFSLRKGDVVITKDSETRDDIGMAAYVAEDVESLILGYHCALIRPKKELNGAWLNGFLNSEFGRKYFSFQSSGSGQRYTLTKDAIGAIQIPEVDYETQKEVGRLLTLIDRKIRNGKKISSLLEEQAKTIYDYWFTQFDFPNEDGRPYKSSGGKMVWDVSSKKNEPFGWNCSRMSDAIEGIRTGLNPRNNFKLGKGSIRYITVKNLQSDGVLDFSGCDNIDEAARAMVHRRSDICPGDILFASIAPLGRCYLIQEVPVDWDINESVFSIRCKVAAVTPEYLYMYLKSNAFVKESTACSTGSVFKGIRINTLQDSRMLLPPMRVLEMFSNITKPIFFLQHKLNEEIHFLKQLRDWLLPMLMNGQCLIK